VLGLVLGLELAIAFDELDVDVASTSSSSNADANPGVTVCDNLYKVLLNFSAARSCN